MDGVHGLGEGLAALVATLESRRLALLDELRQVEQEIQATRQTAAAAERMGLGIASRVSAPRSVTKAAEQSRPTDVIPFTGRRPAPQPPSDFEVRSAVMRTIGPARNDDNIPSMLDDKRVQLVSAGLPSNEAAVQAILNNVAGIATKAAASSPGPGGRRSVSTRGLIPGEPITPIIRRVMKAADRPLTTHEVTLAMLAVRGLNYRGRELAGIANRVSSLLAQEAKLGRIARVPNEDSSRKLWIWARQVREPDEAGA